MTSLNLPHESIQSPGLARPRGSQRTTWLLILLAALMIIAAVWVCSWAASSGLVLDYMGEPGLSRLDADYSPWEMGAPPLPLDIPRLGTAAVRGEGDWSEGNLPAPATTPTPTDTPFVVIAAPNDTPTDPPTDTPTDPPTATNVPRNGGGPTPVPPTPVPPTPIPPTVPPPTPVPPTPIPPPPTDPPPPPTVPPPPPTNPPPPPTDPPPPATPTPCSGIGC